MAQLGARLTGSQKVRGSNPLGSTIVLKPHTLGCTITELRGAIGWEEFWRTLCLHGYEARMSHGDFGVPGP